MAQSLDPHVGKSSTTWECVTSSLPFHRCSWKPDLDRVRMACRARHYSRRTEEAYVYWVRRFVLFNDKRHPAEMGASEATRFLTHLAVVGRVSASTQNQALAAILFLYRCVLEQELPWLEDVVRAKRPVRLPVVLTREEARSLLAALADAERLVVALLYGAGLREKKRTLANSTYTEVTYDGFRRPTDIDHKASGGTRFAGFAYAWDEGAIQGKGQEIDAAPQLLTVH